MRALQHGCRSAGRWAWRHFRLVAGIALVVGLALTLASNREAIAAVRWTLAPWTLAGAVALLAVAPLAQAPTLRITLRRLGAGAAPVELLRIWGRSFLLRYEPSGAVGFAHRVRERERLAATTPQVLTATGYEQLAAITAGAIAAVVGFVIAGMRTPLVALVLLAVTATVALALRPAWLGDRLARWAARRGIAVAGPLRQRTLALMVAIRSRRLGGDRGRHRDACPWPGRRGGAGSVRAAGRVRAVVRRGRAAAAAAGRPRPARRAARRRPGRRRRRGRGGLAGARAARRVVRGRARGGRRRRARRARARAPLAAGPGGRPRGARRRRARTPARGAPTAALLPPVPHAPAATLLPPAPGAPAATLLPPAPGAPAATLLPPAPDAPAATLLPPAPDAPAATLLPPTPDALVAPARGAPAVALLPPAPAALLPRTPGGPAAAPAAPAPGAPRWPATAAASVAAAPAAPRCDQRTIVVVPTYDELESLPLVVERFAPTGLDLLIVDDSSPDGTGELAEQLAAQRPWMHVMHRADKDGLGMAYRAGFAWCQARGYGVIGQMDCDLSHPPEKLARCSACSSSATPASCSARATCRAAAPTAGAARAWR
jgi:hypothetical protein